MTERKEPLSPVKRAVLALNAAQKRIDELEEEKSAPIAVIGMACRFPGGADTPEAFWKLLTENKDAVRAAPTDRWNTSSAFARAARRYPGGYLDAIDHFDPAFFGISPREAHGIDPQQRLVLEVAWEALEAAGQKPAHLAGTRAAVMLGVSTDDYAERLRFYDPALLDAYAVTGNGHSFASGRLAYHLGFHGPCVSIDTACSSALVAVHLACLSLRSGEATLAIAGGVNLILSPVLTELSSKLKALSPTGRCKTFDARADGFVRGEGCGMVVLKRLADAERDGDRIDAVIRSSAVNHGGTSTGLTAPSVLGQQRLLEEALHRGSVRPTDVSFVETHGTGTSLGDPIELESLREVYGVMSDGASPCVLGAVKTNVGHLEAAAGAAGLIKTILALRHGTIPANLHFHTLNPRIRLDDTRFVLPTSNMDWPDVERRVAGVSSFGMGGTNAHVIVEAPSPTATDEPSSRTAQQLFVLSAAEEPALRESAARHARFLKDNPAVEASAVARTLCVGRADLAHRLTIVASDLADVVRNLDSFAQGEQVSGVEMATASKGVSRVAFLFTGQGAQYGGMAKELYDVEPVFRATFDACAKVADEHLERSLHELVFTEEEEGPLHQTANTQPCLFAVELALADLWMSWGVKPQMFLGHSIGEYVAAALIGVMSREDAMALVCERGKLMQQLPAGGAMVSLQCAEEAVLEVLRGDDNVVSVAAVNAPNLVVISGLERDVERVAQALPGVKSQRLRVSHAFHSPLMEPILDRFEERVAAVKLNRPSLPLISNVTGREATDELATPSYWREHLRSGVRFADGARRLEELGANVFVEIGPHPVLCGLVGQSISSEGALFLPSLRRREPSRGTMLSSLGRLYTRHAAFDCSAAYVNQKTAPVALPTYPWQRKRYWLDEPATSTVAGDASDRLFDGCAMEVRFERASVTAMGRTPGAWLVLADMGGVGRALASAIKSRGGSCLLVGRDGVDGSDVSAADAEGVSRALSAAAEQLSSPLVGVIDLWPLDATTSEDASAEELVHKQRLVSVGALYVAQAMVGQERLQGRLVIVTRGAQRAADDDDTVEVSQAPAWGFARTLYQEQPALRPLAVDLDPRAAPGSAAEIDALVRALLAKGLGPQAAVRRGELLTASLQRHRGVPSEQPVALRKAATYVVTGGLGGLGYSLAKWLLRRGAGRVLCLGRRAPSDEQREEMAQLSSGGASIEARQLDIADEDQVATLFDEVDASGQPLAGVFHAAGTLRDAVMTDQTADSFHHVMEAKVRGGWNLHRQTRARALDHFVLYSSMAATFGAPGQANYAAANSFLDALATHRRTLRLPGTAIGWGPVEGVGMAARLSRRVSLNLEGLTPFSVEQSEDLVAALLRHETPHIVVALADLDAAKVAFPSAYDDEGSGESAEEALLVELRAARGGARNSLLEARVRRELAAIFGWDDTDAHAAPADHGLSEMGLDSLMAVELRNRLQRLTGRSLSATLAFDHPTITALVDHLLDVLELGGDEAVAVAAAVGPRNVDEPIAIVGASCRFPGDANGLDAFWQLLHEGRDAIGSLPDDRWRDEEFLDHDPDKKGRYYVSAGGFVQDLACFDAGFFRLSGREAQSLDPQQRMLLEVSWEALEDADIVPEALKGTRTGVFVGLAPSEYWQLQGNSFDSVDVYSGTGAGMSFAAGRIAYGLGVHGPTLAVDTACSSSLVALHLACESLRSGECSVALAGGANALVSPWSYVALSRLRALSPTGRCKTFDASADGYVRGEGAGVVVLKRLSEAVQSGDRILAVIRSTAINHDGPSSGLTVPSGPAQEAVIRAALAKADLVPADVDYLEAHGTGTSLGDPLELQAAVAVYGDGRAEDRPLIIGSVKTNVGHLEPAAGMAGLLKVVASLLHEEIPPHLHFETPSPHIPWSELPLKVPSTSMPWPRSDSRRRAAVSAFGLSGTNAHVILEEAPQAARGSDEMNEELAGAGVELPSYVLPLSARSELALRNSAKKMATYLSAHPEVPLADVCLTAGAGRTHHAHRLAVIASSPDELRASLLRFSEGDASPNVVSNVAGRTRPQVLFLFTGQGAQYAGMARALYELHPEARASFDACARISDPLLERPLLDVIFGDDDAELTKTLYTQPALFALEYAIASLWRSWGVEPAAVLGHSVGEYVAAVMAGVMGLEDAVRLLCARAKLIQSLPAGGAMTSIQAPEEEVRAAISSTARDVSVAAVNGVEQVVISGAEADVDAVAALLRAAGKTVKRLSVSHAFHSSLLDPITDEFEREAAQVTCGAPHIPLISNVTGAALDGAVDAAYWRQHLRGTVRFADGVQAAIALGADTLLEVGPHPVLVGMASQSEKGSTLRQLSSLRKGRPDWTTLMRSVGELYTAGASIDWRAFYGITGARMTRLPTYAFQRERHWSLPVPSRSEGSLAALQARSGGAAAVMGGRRLKLPGTDLHYHFDVSLQSHPYLVDHLVFDIPVAPGAFHLSLFLELAGEVVRSSTFQLEDAVLRQAFPVTDEASHLAVSFTPDPMVEQSHRVVSSTMRSDSDTFTKHAEGRVGPMPEDAVRPPPLALDAIRSRCTKEIDLDYLYEVVRTCKIGLGPAFHTLQWLASGEREMLFRISLRDVSAGTPWLHPASLDACFHGLAGFLVATGQRREPTPLVPFSVDRTRAWARPEGEVWCHLRLRDGIEVTDEMIIVDLELARDDGTVFVEIDGLSLKRATESSLLGRTDDPLAGRLYEESWTEAPVAAKPVAVTEDDLVVATGDPTMARELADAFQRRGQRLLYLEADELDAGRELVDQLRQGRRRCSSAVYLAPGAVSDEDLESALAVTAPFVAFVQRWTSAALRDPPRLFVATRGAQREPGSTSAVEPPQAALWGLARVAALEHPELRCTRVDLSMLPAALEWDALTAELTSASRDDEVMLRDERRLVGRLAPARSPEARVRDRLERATAGSVLISGGLGGIGLALAADLVDKGATALVLMGRSAPAEDAAEKIRALESLGATVIAVRGDVSSRADVERAVAAADEVAPLTAVFHLAAVLDDGPIEKLDAARLRAVLTPKVAGAALLHDVTRDRDLAAFVLFSSFAGVLGSPGQGSYAAANRYLDALAQRRRAAGAHALSVSWGPVGEVGMAAASSKRGRRLASRGVESLTPDDMLAALWRLVEADVATASVVDLDIRRWLDFYPAASELSFIEPLKAKTREESVVRGSGGQRFAAELAAVPLEERAALLETFIRAEMSKVLELPAASISPETPFADLGIDSLMGIEIRNTLEAQLAVRLPASLLWQYPTLSSLQERILSLMTPAAAPVVVTPPAASVPAQSAADVNSLKSELESLSDDDVLAMAARELALTSGEE